MPQGANTPEILAPAGNMEMLRAAVYAGADAVYLGLLQFNARRTAGNFSAAALCEAAAFCRARDVRVYVTLNTVLYPGELPAVAQSIREAAAAGADALIVQDLAAAALARRIAPELALHASTQMSVHSAAGVRQLQALGFSRAILARELSLEEIGAIAAHSEIELECFVHGALCMSISGQCYMSAFLGGRSGNRGACAGPCRLPFSAGAPGACHLSLKDHSHIAQLPQLAAAGVASAKIEGRLRSPEYVAAAVSACRAAREGRPYDAELLQNVFSRSGFTNGYITGRRDGAMFGVRTEADAAAAKDAAPKLRELFRREFPGVPVKLSLTLTPAGACLTAADAAGHTVTAQGQTPPQPAEKDPREAYRRALEKTGGTPFYAAESAVSGEGYVPLGEVNALRRRALEELLALREGPAPHPVKEAGWRAPAPRLPAVKVFSARFAAAGQIPAPLPEGLARILLPLEQWEQVPPNLRPKTWLELPRAAFGPQEEQARRMVTAAQEAGFAGFVAQNLAHFPLLQGLPVLGGFGLNVTNPLAAQQYRALGALALTASPEAAEKDLPALCGAGTTLLLAYGHMPLMLTRACPLHNVHGCAGCKGEGELLDRKGMRFPVRCTGPAGVRTVYNPVPLYLADRADKLAADEFLLYFTIESPEEAAGVLTAALAGRPFDGAFTRGLVFKQREDAGCS